MKLGQKAKKKVLHCAVCDRPVVRNQSQISYGGKAYCSRCSKNSGATHGNWKEGRYYSGDGYVMILHKGSYVKEHIVRWQEANKACVVPWENAHVHHINFIEHGKDYNEPDNLVLLSAIDHGRLHRAYDYQGYTLALEILFENCKKQLYYPKQADRFKELLEHSVI